MVAVAAFVCGTLISAWLGYLLSITSIMLAAWYFRKDKSLSIVSIVISFITILLPIAMAMMLADVLDAFR